MTASSPILDSGKQLSVSLLVNGSTFDASQLVSIDIWQAANRVPRARIMLDDARDGGNSSSTDSQTLTPGTRVEIAAGYDGDTETLFSGVIISQSLKIDPDGLTRLVLDCSDALLRMTLSRSSLIWEQTTDAELISALISANGGTVGKNSAATTPHPNFVQAHASDWDVMLMRAEANGCVLIVNDGRVDIVLPSEVSASRLKLDYGDSIISLDLSIAATEQLGATAIATSAWNYADQVLTTVTPSAANVTVPGNLSSATLANVFNVANAPQRTGASMPEPLLADWATGTLMRHKIAQVRGSVRFQGSALAKPGTLVTLGNVGQRFSGDAWVGAVSHCISDGTWQTTVEIGLPAQSSLVREPAVADVAAVGLLPPLKGLQTGKVTKIAGDPSGEFRVQVRLPLFDADHSIWARLASFYGSSGFGAVFVPEIDDEVLLGFMNDDPSNPVILGSVYSSLRSPSHPPTEENAMKAIVTRSKMEIEFNDEDVVLKISTPGGRVVTLDDKTGTVSIVDPNNNRISMDGHSVDIVSGSDLSIASAGNMSIDCGGNLAISATVLASVTATEISVSANADLKFSASAIASLKAGAAVEINGALVKIN